MNSSWRASVVCAMLATALAGCGGSDDAERAPALPREVAADPCPALDPPASPAPVSAATGVYLCAANLGVSNLEAAVAFYTSLGLREKARLRRAGRDEVVLASEESKGAHLVLFTHTDGVARDYRRNPGKLVFYTKDAAAFAARFAAAGGQLTRPPEPYGGTVVGFGRDPDNNLVEIAFHASASASYLSALGIGVTDLEAARSFYADTLGFAVAAKLSVTRPGPGGGLVPWYNEYILSSATGRGSAVVLMHYTDGAAHDYSDRPVALSLRVDDPAAFARRIDAAPGAVLRPPAVSSDAALAGAVHGVARDADGTLLHFYRSPAVATCASIAAAGASGSATGAYLCAGGLGVSDLEVSTAFYKAAFGMTERARLDRDDRIEVVLDSADRRGAQLVLFHFKAGATVRYDRNPGKVVFYVRDLAATSASLSAAGSTASPPAAFAGRQVSFARDPDGNLLEMATAADAAVSYISAFGVGVSDLESAKGFYVDVLDMKLGYPDRIAVAKAPGQPWYDEYILTSKAARGASIVLMSYTDGAAHSYRDNPVKLVLRADRPGAYAHRILDAGHTVVRAPAADPALGDALVGDARDADGTRLELLSAPH